MTQNSYVWGGTVVGDATLAPYSDDEWAEIWGFFLQQDRTTQGVLDTLRAGYTGDLEVSIQMTLILTLFL